MNMMTDLFSDSGFCVTFFSVLGFAIILVTMMVADKITDKKRAKKREIK
jgi:hypothetical protein